MKLNVSMINKDDIERFLLIINIGLMAAIKEGVVDIHEADTYLYSPYSAKKLEMIDVSKDIIDLIHLGWELEDVKSLIPEKMDKSIDEIRNKSIDLLRSMPKTKHPLKKWID